MKNINIKTIITNLVSRLEQPLIHETADLFPVKIENKIVLHFCKLFYEIWNKKIAVKPKNTSFQNEKQLFSQSLYSRMRITSKTVHDINKMEDNFELRYVQPRTQAIFSYTRCTATC
jgi:hypothetical protein